MSISRMVSSHHLNDEVTLTATHASAREPGAAPGRRSLPFAEPTVTGVTLPSAAEIGLPQLKQPRKEANTVSSAPWEGVAAFSDHSELAPTPMVIEAPTPVSTTPTATPVPLILPAHELARERASSRDAPAKPTYDLRPAWTLSSELSSKDVFAPSESPLALRNVQEPSAEVRSRSVSEPMTGVRPPAARKPPTSSPLAPREWLGLAHDLQELFPGNPSPSPPLRRARAAPRSREVNKENEVARVITFGETTVGLADAFSVSMAIAGQ